MQLNELQTLFQRALTGSRQDAQELAGLIIRHGSLAPVERLRIYRESSEGNACKALAGNFPLCEQILGEEFFFECALKYAREFPMTAEGLNLYGEMMPDFLQRFVGKDPVFKDLAYIPDVARFDRAWLEVFFEADAEIMDASDLAAIAPNKIETVRLNVIPAFRLLKTNVSVFDLYHYVHDQRDTEFHINEGSFYTLVWRQDLNRKLLQLSEELVPFVNGLQRNESVGSIFGQAPYVDKPELFQQHLKLALDQGWLTAD